MDFPQTHRLSTSSGLSGFESRPRSGCASLKSCRTENRYAPHKYCRYLTDTNIRKKKKNQKGESARPIRKGPTSLRNKNPIPELYEFEYSTDFITFAVANISLAKRCGGCAVDFCAVDSHFSPASLGWAGTLQQFYKRQVFRWNGRFCGSHAYR